MNQLSLFERLGFSTIRIEGTLEGGVTSTGTGFFMKFCDDGKHFVPAIVTNNHVIKDAKYSRLFFTLSKTNAIYPAYGHNYEADIYKFEKAWRSHPDPEIDLCAMPISDFIHNIEKKLGTRPFIHFLDLSLLPTDADIEDMAGLEKVTMIGYPNGLWDPHYNQPIFRSGILATHYKFDWNGKPEFVIDAACFPGSSGSPVMNIDIGQVYSKKGFAFGTSRVKLLGVLHAGPVISADGSIVIEPTPTSNKISICTPIQINLGYVIKASKLIDFNPVFESELNDQK